MKSAEAAILSSEFPLRSKAKVGKAVPYVGLSPAVKVHLEIYRDLK